MTAPAPVWPQIRTAGIDGILVTFGPALSEPANRAALAFRAAVDGAGWDGVEETSTSLVSAFVRFDPLHLTHKQLHTHLNALLSSTNWFEAPLPTGRRFFRIPTVFGTDLAPQLEDAAEAAGVTVSEALKTLSETRVRVQTLGFAPGQPYLGVLPENWDIPRLQNLTPKVDVGALVVAIRQLVLFSVSTPTGWRHVGQTPVRLFQPDGEDPFLLRPGDEVQFRPISREEYEGILQNDPSGGVQREALV